MKEKEISDDEIQILGSAYKTPETTGSARKKRRWAAGFVIAITIIVACITFIMHYHQYRPPANETNPVAIQLEFQPEETITAGYIEVCDETVNDIPLRIYTPINAFPELSLSLPDETDSTIVFITPAADIRADNNNILGDFVLKGERLARGISKKGFCSIINQTLTIGMNTETPLLQDAIREKGYFFRQYPLVHNSQAIYNQPKGKSIRRALAIRNDEIIMIESLERESFHDFAQALADAGIAEAVYLRGGTDIYGWYREQQGKQTFFGTKKENFLKGENFIVWKSSKK